MFLKSSNQDLSRLSGEVMVLMRRGQCLAPQTGLAWQRGPFVPATASLGVPMALLMPSCTPASRLCLPG